MKTNLLIKYRSKYIKSIKRNWSHIAFIKLGKRLIPFGYNHYLARGINALKEEHSFIKSLLTIKINTPYK